MAKKILFLLSLLLSLFAKQSYASLQVEDVRKYQTRTLGWGNEKHNS